MSKKYEIYLSDELSTIVDARSADLGIRPSDFIPSIIAQSLEDELSSSQGMESFEYYYSTLLNAIHDYVDTLPLGTEFQLRDISLYNEIPRRLRLRLSRSVNYAIADPNSDLGKLVERAHRKKDPDKVKLVNGAAVYRRRSL